MTIDVSLRDVSKADLRIFYEQQLDPEATAMAAFPPRDRDSFMAHWTRIMADKSVTLKTILFDDQVAGNIISWEQDGEREVGYWVGKEFWGKGIATKALVEFITQVNVRPLVAHVARHNIASRRVLEKCEFTFIKGDTHYNASGEVIEEVILKLV